MTYCTGVFFCLLFASFLCWRGMSRWMRSPVGVVMLMVLAAMMGLRPANVAVQAPLVVVPVPPVPPAVTPIQINAERDSMGSSDRVSAETAIPAESRDDGTLEPMPPGNATSFASAKTVHITVRGVLPKKFAACVKSFYQHGFNVVVWTRDQPQPFLDKIEPSIRDQIEVRSMVAYERGLPDRLLNVVPFQILADYGGWHYSGNYVCLRNVASFVALTQYSPVVMGYDPLRKRPSILAMYFCNSTLPRELAGRILSDRSRRHPAKVVRDALNEWNLFHMLLPMHVLLYGTNAWGVIETDGVPRHHALAVTYEYSVRYPVTLPAERLQDPSGVVEADVCGASYRHGHHLVNATLAHFLWLGGELQPMAWCAIDTFVRQGFFVYVWTYDMHLALPNGAALGNLKDHYPSDFRFTITQKGRRGSPSAFSNIFRYRILELYGGWWFDTDVLCLRPAADFAKLAELRPITVGFEDPSMIDGAVMHFANRTIAPVMMARAEKVLELHNRSVEWGMLGPRLITAVMEDLNLSVLGYPEWLFYPVHWTQWHLLFQKQFTRSAEDTCRYTYAVHLWNEVTNTKVTEAGSFVDKIIGHCSQRRLVLSPLSKGGA